jgi:hypothetical protein
MHTRHSVGEQQGLENIQRKLWHNLQNTRTLALNPAVAAAAGMPS